MGDMAEEQESHPLLQHILKLQYFMQTQNWIQTPIQDIQYKWINGLVHFKWMFI